LPNNKASKQRLSSWTSISTSLAVFIPIVTTLIIGIAIAKQTLLYHLLGITVTAQVSQATIITTGLITAFFVSMLALPIFYFLGTMNGKISKERKLLSIIGIVTISILIIATGSVSTILGRAAITIIGTGLLSVGLWGYADIIHSIRTSKKDLNVEAALLKFIGVTIALSFITAAFIVSSIRQQIDSVDYHTTFKDADKSYVIISKENNNYLVSELCDKKNIVKYGSFRYIAIEKVTETSLQVFALRPHYCHDLKKVLPRYIL
jgi:hypothetical protein